MYTTVLLDAGGVILDETLYEEDSCRIITKILSKQFNWYSEELYWADLNESINVYSPHNRQYIFWKYSNYDKDTFMKYWHEFTSEWNSIKHELKMMVGIKDQIIELKNKYKIVLAGQYGFEIIDFLGKQGILNQFENNLSQDNFEITKPDPRYLVQICESAHVLCNECIMVGDRIDKDIIPAKQNNIGTVFVKTGVYKNQRPRTMDEIPDINLESIDNLANEIEKFV